MGKLRVDFEFRDLRDIYLWARDQDAPEARRLSEILGQKIEAAARREMFARYKTAPTAEAREAARRAYLDAAGVPDSYRWGCSDGDARPREPRSRDCDQ